MVNKGELLERKVAKALKKAGKHNIKTNLLIYDKNRNRSEIDIRYGLIFRKYVECKNYDGQVPLEMVTKFKEVLKQNKIPLRKGIFVNANGDYSPRCYNARIKLYSFKQFEKKLTFQKWRRRIVYSALCLSLFLGYQAKKEYDSLNWFEKWRFNKKVEKQVEKSKEYVNDFVKDISDTIQRYRK